MRKSRRLVLPLMSLALAAVVTPLLLTRSCMGLRKDDDARAAQRRATGVAAQFSKREEKKPARRGPLDGSGIHFGGATRHAEAAQRRAAQRDFLTDAAHRNPANAEDIAQQVEKYRENKAEWIEELFDGHGENVPDTGKSGQAGSRELLDRGRSDLSVLTPEAWKKWEEWEAKQWRDYPFSTDERNLRNSLERRKPLPPPAETDFRVRTTAYARSLLNELEYLEDMDLDLARELQRQWQQKNGKPDNADLIAASRKQIEDDRALVSAQLDRIALAEGAMQRLWRERGWEGYLVPATDTASVVTNTLQVPPGYVPAGIE